MLIPPIWKIAMSERIISDLSNSLDRWRISRIIKIKEACLMTSLSEATINRKIRKKEFPAKLELSTKRRGFYESEILEWVATRTEATRQ